jgi:Ala-tRNA(Pro) deacylase
MEQILGVKQGCVTAFALLNDIKIEVKFLADEALVDGTYNRVYFHPLTNTATMGIGVQDFKKFVEKTGHSIVTIKF